MASKNFLHILHDPPNADIDIVAVHGLNPTNTEKHAEQTWTLEGKFWLKDFLHKRIPTARILLFGYNANVAFETSTAGVREHSENLLNRLKSKRRAAPNRPIIFVCHSLGGIVVKQALVHARLDQTYTAIRAATYGIAFFGTPHRGGNNAFLGEIGSKIARTVMRSPSNTLLEALKKESLYGEEIRGNFRHSLEDFQMLSFYETRPFKKLGLIVDKNSATLGLAGPRERQIAMDADHSHICKFASEADDNYEQVADNLAEMVEEALQVASSQTQLVNLQPPIAQPWTDIDGASPGLEACLRSLSFPEMNMREYSVEEATDQTCVWLLTHKAYISWTESSSSLLWIMGKPGAGKSTLMRFAHNQAKKDDALVASFYFNGRGTPDEKTGIGMYRSLLYQLLPFASQQLQEKMCRVYIQRCRTIGAYSVSWKWHETELSKALTEVIADLKDHHLRIYIDALDESGENTALELVPKFQSMVQRATESRSSLKVCCSCRHYPLIAEGGLTISMENENADDIELYVRDRLAAASCPKDQIEKLTSAITTRANGVFQWVNIVQHRLWKDLKARRRTEDILLRLREVPKELDGLYKEMISGFDSDNDRLECANLMRWMCFAFRPLSLSELRHALLLQPDSTFASLQELKSHRLYIDNDKDMEIRILQLSRGLVEVQEPKQGIRVAGFVHESVKDFLIKGGGLRMLETSFNTDLELVEARAYLRLSWCKVRYLEAFVLDQKVVRFTTHANTFPLAEYAVRTWFVNYYRSENPEITEGFYKFFSHMCYPQQGTSRLQKLQTWDPGATGNFGSEGWRDVAFVFGLTICYKQYAVAYKLAVNYTANYTDSFPILFRVGVELGETSFLRFLLRQPDFNINVADTDGDPLLYIALFLGDSSIFRMLVDHKNTDINIQDNLKRTALHIAISERLFDQVQILLEHNDIKVNIQSFNGLTPLHCAAGHNVPEIIKLLLGHKDIRVNIQSSKGHTPLHIAIGFHAYDGRDFLEIIKLLLGHKDIKVNIQDSNGDTPLDFAICEKTVHDKDFLDIIRSLLGYEDIEVDWRNQEGKPTSLLNMAKKYPQACHAIIDLLERKLREQRQGVQQRTYALRPRKRIRTSLQQSQD